MFTVLWDVALCIVLETDRLVTGIYSLTALMIEAASTFETSGQFLPDYMEQHSRHLHTRRLENLKYHTVSSRIIKSARLAFSAP
jgi:hypothetical protein